MPNSRTKLAVCCSISALVCVTFSHSSQAEPKPTPETTVDTNGYEYKFIDDDLLGSTLANSGDIFGGRKHFQRSMLIRPRTDLRPQMFKSVENL